MLKPITKLRRTFDDGSGGFYYCGTSRSAQRPLSTDDVLDKLDKITDRLNVLSEIENKRKEK